LATKLAVQASTPVAGLGIRGSTLRVTPNHVSGLVPIAVGTYAAQVWATPPQAIEKTPAADLSTRPDAVKIVWV